MFFSESKHKETKFCDPVTNFFFTSCNHSFHFLPCQHSEVNTLVDIKQFTLRFTVNYVAQHYIFADVLLAQDSKICSNETSWKTHRANSINNVTCLAAAWFWVIPLPLETRYNRRTVQQEAWVTVKFIDDSAICGIISQCRAITKCVVQWNASYTKKKQKNQSKRISFGRQAEWLLFNQGSKRMQESRRNNTQTMVKNQTNTFFWKTKLYLFTWCIVVSEIHFPKRPLRT